MLLTIDTAAPVCNSGVEILVTDVTADSDCVLIADWLLAAEDTVLLLLLVRLPSVKDEAAESSLGVPLLSAVEVLGPTPSRLVDVNDTAVDDNGVTFVSVLVTNPLELAKDTATVFLSSAPSGLLSVLAARNDTK